tara:strand:+ start:285 stop:608 length:324 start_codon:yes stop_codon:yes gene_type:complete
MRKLTKLEAQLLGVKPSDTFTMNEVLAGRKVHPRHFRNGRGQHFELLGMSPARIAQILDTLDIRGKDLEHGNDAPRGGVEGEWVKLSSSGRAKARRRLVYLSPDLNS